MRSYIPEGLSCVTPYLIVEDAQALTDFMVSVFDARQVVLDHDDDGAIRHVRYLIGDASVELAQAKPQWPALVSALHVDVPDVDACFARALTAGATISYEPAQMDYGERSAGFDACGVRWFIATATA